MRRTAWPTWVGMMALGLVSFLSGASLAGSTPAGRGAAPVVGERAEPGAWGAWDRLDAGGGFPAAGGFWAQAGLRSWEALPGAMQILGRAGIEPRRGPGLFVEASGLSMPAEAGPWKFGVGGVLRTGAVRFEAMIENAGFAGASVRSGRVHMLVDLIPGWLCGGSVDGVMGSPGGASTVTPEAWTRIGVWDLGVQIRDALDAVVGLRPRPELTAFARFLAGTVSAGVVLDWEWAVLRGEVSDHPHLGRTARVSLGVRGSR